MRHRKVITLSAVFVLVTASLVALLLAPGLAAHAARKPGRSAQRISAAIPSTTCSSQAFIRTPSPNVGTTGSVLTRIAVTSSSDVWAVGYSGSPPEDTSQTLIEHWSGATWGVVPSPDPGAWADALWGIGLLSPTNAWAVGSQQSLSSSAETSLVEHWDGSQWSVIGSANAPGTGSYTFLSGVSALSANDIWAVGHSLPASAASTSTFSEHWDGSSWTAVPTPNLGPQYNYLEGVAGISSDDVWAVGWAQTSVTAQTAIVEHWNGTAWSLVSTPNVGSSQLFSLEALSSTDVWAVGQYTDAGATMPAQTLVEHWDGTTWSVLPSPNVNTTGRNYNTLYSVTASSSSDVWATGQYAFDTAGQIMLTLVLHWNGTAWSIVPSTNPNQAENNLQGVVDLSPAQVWAVGNTNNTTGLNGAQTLIEHLGKNPMLLNCPK